MRPTFVLCAVVVGGCLTGPRYRPVNSPPAKTNCLDERALANVGREQLLQNPDQRHRAITAAAVLLHADCERRELERLKLMAGGLTGLPAAVERALAQYDRALSLYNEATAYGVRGITQLTRAASAALHRSLAQKLREIDLTGDVSPAERAVLRQEIDELADRHERMALAPQW